MMKCYKKYNRRKGMALIVILMFVAVVMIVGLGFIVRGDTELACGQNMELKADMDYLAESGLEHAKGLILNPQDTSGDYWVGAVRQQINPGSDDYYDVNILQLSPFNYQITSFGYREDGGQVTAQGSLTAELRLNPCIVYWQSKKSDIPASVVIGGDAYFDDDVINYGNINGDVYSKKTITSILPGQIQGQLYPNTAQAPVSTPGILPNDFKSNYYIGTISYSVEQRATGTQTGLILAPSDTNPAGIYYYDGTLEIDGDSFINGTLVVKEDLKIKGTGRLTIQSVKNFPALIVEHDLTAEDKNTALTATGYVQIGHHIDMKDKTGCSIIINGALYIFGDGIKNSSNGSVSVNGMPNGMPQKAALAIWSSGGNLVRWSPAAGAFYKTIVRNP
jgi:cytoskeletal protein CcmA (bactofilin family)